MLLFQLLFGSIFRNNWFGFFIFSVLSLNFNKIMFVFTVGVTRKISNTNRSYSELSKTVPLAITSTTVYEKGKLQRKEHK